MVLEELGSFLSVVSECNSDLRSHLRSALRHPRGHSAHHNLHHRQVFQVVMRLEQGIAREEFDQDAPDREHVAGV